MIKLSKIKIFKRATLSVLGIAFIAGGVFMATKIASIFHVNAADPANGNEGTVTIRAPKDSWVLYNASASGNDDINWRLSTPTIGVSDANGQTIKYDAYCIEPTEQAPGQEEGGAQYTRYPLDNDKIKLAIYMSSAYGTEAGDIRVDGTTINAIMDGWFDFSDTAKWSSSRWNGLSAPGSGVSGYIPNVSNAAGKKNLKYLFMHLLVAYLYGGGLPSDITADETALINAMNEYLTRAINNSEDTWLMAQNYVLYQIDPKNPDGDPSIQNVVWIEDGNPEYGNIEVKKCDSKTQSKCSGEEFDGIKFTLYNNSGHRIYAAGINENGGPFFDNGAKMLEATITDGTGKVTFKNLPLGVQYRIEESGTNNYYILTPPTSKTITLDRNGGTGHLTFNNKGVSLDTTATDAEDGDKFVQAGTTSYIKDVVEYCVVPNKEYTIKGKLMDKSTGKELLIGGEPVTSEVTFTPTTSCGTAEMTFEFDSSELGGKDLVVFESLYLDNELITSHEEIDDPDQTIRVVSLGTTATDASDGDKTIIADGEATINDRIKYCLVAGKEYTIIGTLMNKSTGEPIKSNNEVVSKSITITPEEDCGEVDMEFKFDATGLGGTDVVVFEKALILNSTTDDYDTIVSHEDLDDEGQTIKIVDKAPETGMFTGSASSTTGGINIPTIIAISISAISVGTYIVARSTAKKRFFGRR